MAPKRCPRLPPPGGARARSGRTAATARHVSAVPVDATSRSRSGMLDYAVAVRKSGALVWDHAWSTANGSRAAPVDALIQRVLLEERGGATDEFHDDDSAVRWVIDNEADLLVAAVYQRTLSLPYVDELLGACRTALKELLLAMPAEQRDDAYPCADFTRTFDGLHAEAEKRAVEERMKARKQRSFVESKKYNNTRQGQKESALGIAPPAPPKDPRVSAKAPAPVETTEAAEEVGAPGRGLSTDDIAANIAKLKASGGPAGRRKKGGPKGADGKDDDEEGGKPRGKAARVWDGGPPEEGGGKGGGRKSLDFSKQDGEGGGGGGGRPRVAKYTSARSLDLDAEFGGEGAASSANLADKPADKSGGGFSGLASLRGLVGSKQLERSDLEAPLEKLQDRLVSKNVAQHIARDVCESVSVNLQGKSASTWTSLASTVKAAMSESLARILTPTRPIDVLAEVAAAKAAKRPCVIVFVGVNGVGKSTSLSKVAYYIRSNGYTPMLCACDTFRSGAVEQLRVHAQSLDVPLYEKGYGRDAAGIATDGISYAQQMGYDAVLVDTAGRMQDNEPLMRALAKLVHVNSPDLVLFVGEALVGNDAVDQATQQQRQRSGSSGDVAPAPAAPSPPPRPPRPSAIHVQVNGFNAALGDYAISKTPRLIDGLVLTKFDTISDKVGAALSLVFTTGKPIVFVGVGQTYEDIRNLNVDHVVKALLA